MTERLFAVWPTPTERASLRRVNRGRETSLFDVEVPEVPELVPCPACAGLGDACTCHRTGAVALRLVPSCDHCGRAETCTCTSAQRDEYRLTAEDEQRVAERISWAVDEWRAAARGTGRPFKASAVMVDQLERIGAHAIGCGPADLRDSERAWIASTAGAALA